MITLIEIVLLNALLAYSGYIVLSGGTFSMGFPAFVGIGAYTGAILAVDFGLGIWPALGISIVLAVVGGMLISGPLARLSGIYLSIATVTLVAVLQVVLLNWRSLTNGATGIFSVPVEVGLAHLAVALLVVLLVLVKVDRSSLGRAIRMVRLDPMIASAMGVNVPRIRLGLLLASSVLAAVGGVLRVFYFGFAIPQAFGFPLLIALLAIVLIGGVEHWSGPLIGAVVFTGLPRILQPFGAWTEVAIGLVLLTVVLVMPNGISGQVVNLLKRRKRKGTRDDLATASAPVGIEP